LNVSTTVAAAPAARAVFHHRARCSSDRKKLSVCQRPAQALARTSSRLPIREDDGPALDQDQIVLVQLRDGGRNRGGRLIGQQPGHRQRALAGSQTPDDHVERSTSERTDRLPLGPPGQEHGIHQLLGPLDSVA